MCPCLCRVWHSCPCPYFIARQYQERGISKYEHGIKEESHHVTVRILTSRKTQITRAYTNVKLLISGINESIVKWLKAEGEWTIGEKKSNCWFEKKKGFNVLLWRSLDYMVKVRKWMCLAYRLFITLLTSLITTLEGWLSYTLCLHVIWLLDDKKTGE